MSIDFTLVDTHSHVHFSAYTEDVADVMARADAEGVAMITVGTLKKTSEEAVAYAAAHQNVWAAVGLHPNNIHFILPSADEGSGREEFDHAFYKQLAQHPKVVAIGETGMDTFRIPDGFDRDQVIAEQEEVFRRHLDLCDELNKPVIIHVRDAHAQVTRVLEEYILAGKLTRRGVMHCFTGTPEQAQKYLDLGMYISIPGIVTFPPKKTETENSLHAVVRMIPSDRIVVETDCPYLTPVPHRGERNEPSYVKFTAEHVARVRNQTFKEFAAQSTENARRLFNL